MSDKSSNKSSVQTEGMIISGKDDRAYRHITLPNKLEVLLISDPNTEKVIQFFHFVFIQFSILDFEFIFKNKFEYL
jgi:hypothetical protein